MGGRAILSFIGLRAKMYSILLADGTIKRTGKGITGGAQRHFRHYKDYGRMLKKKTYNVVSMGRIISKEHRLFTVESTKIGLSPLNDKRWMDEHGFTLPFGHYMIDPSPTDD